jgi:hypothetical protein
LATSSTPPSPPPYAPPSYVEIPRKRLSRKWVVAGIVVVCVFLTWQCGSAFLRGRKFSGPAVQHFHQQLNAEDYEGISRDAAEGFGATQSHDELIEFLAAVHKKLGNAGESSFTNIRVDTNTHGTFTTTSYDTTFDHGKAAERFTWVTEDGIFKLYSYHIESNALITN